MYRPRSVEGEIVDADKPGRLAIIRSVRRPCSVGSGSSGGKHHLRPPWTTDNRLCNLSDPTLKVFTLHSGNFDGRHKIWDRCDAVRDTDACTGGRTLSTEGQKEDAGVPLESCPIRHLDAMATFGAPELPALQSSSHPAEALRTSGEPKWRRNSRGAFGSARSEKSAQDDPQLVQRSRRRSSLAVAARYHPHKSDHVRPPRPHRRDPRRCALQGSQGPVDPLLFQRRRLVLGPEARKRNRDRPGCRQGD